MIKFPISGQFLGIFQESRIHFWTSDSDFRDLLDELFKEIQIFKSKKTFAEENTFLKTLF